MQHQRTRIFVTAAVGAVAIVLAACGGSHSTQPPPPAQLQRSSGSATDKIVLSPLGAQRIALQTTLARHPRRRGVSIPASAVIYDASGRTYVFTALGRLTYTEVAVTIVRIDGSAAQVTSGLRAGVRVVSTGAEELYGVQTGVLGQT